MDKYVACSILEWHVLQAEKETLSSAKKNQPQEEEMYFFDMNSVQEFSNPNRTMSSTQMPTDSDDSHKDESEDQGPNAKD